VRNKVKATFNDMGAQTLKNIAEPIHAYRVAWTDTVETTTHKPMADRPSIAVLPFENMSGDPEQAYFSDGITEDIITELSRFRSLLVIARNSTFQFRGKSLDMRDVGQRLGARYLVEGSVRRVNNQVRISAQLIEASSGNHLWADRYDREIADVFAVQDEVARSVVSHLAVRLEDEELQIAKRKPPQDMRAYHLCLQGKRYLDVWSAEGNRNAEEVFKKAISVDPEFARGYAGLAATYLWRLWYSAWNLDDRDMREEALRLARQAVTLDDTDHLPHMIMAWIHHFRREYDLARRHLDRAQALNPNDADALAEAGNMLTIEGEAERGIACVRAAIRLNPHHPDYYLGYLAGGDFFCRNFSEVIRLTEAMAAAFPDGLAFVAAACAYSGDLDNARATMQRFLKLYPAYWKGAPSARQFVGLYEYKRWEDFELAVEGMCKAGMPE
jgi:TolB-like protein/Tfp pilus assembly protein PilF